MRRNKRTITNLSWRDALRTLLGTNNLITIQADEEGIAHLAKGHKDGEYYLITTEPDGTKPEKVKISKNTALTMLSNFYKYKRREVTAAEKILDYIYEWENYDENVDAPETEIEMENYLMNLLYDEYEVYRTITFKEAELWTRDRGIVVEFKNGAVFQITIVQVE